MFDRKRAILQIAEGLCACPECGGTLTDRRRSQGGWGHCRRCRCAWTVSRLGPRQEAYPLLVPSSTCAARARRPARSPLPPTHERH